MGNVIYIIFLNIHKILVFVQNLVSVISFDSVSPEALKNPNPQIKSALILLPLYQGGLHVFLTFPFIQTIHWLFNAPYIFVILKFSLILSFLFCLSFQNTIDTQFLLQWWAPLCVPPNVVTDILLRPEAFRRIFGQINFQNPPIGDAGTSVTIPGGLADLTSVHNFRFYAIELRVSHISPHLRHPCFHFYIIGNAYSISSLP